MLRPGAWVNQLQFSSLRVAASTRTTANQDNKTMATCRRITSQFLFPVPSQAFSKHILIQGLQFRELSPPVVGLCDSLDPLLARVKP